MLVTDSRALVPLGRSGHFPTHRNRSSLPTILYLADGPCIKVAVLRLALLCSNFEVIEHD